MSERKVPTERLSPGDEIDASGGLGFGQSKHRHIRQLPRDNGDRCGRVGHDVVRRRGTKPAVAVEDEDVCGANAQRSPRARVTSDNFGTSRPTRRA